MEIKIYDNGGKTADRYTLYVRNYKDKLWQTYGFSENCRSVQGFNQYCGDTAKPVACGKRIGWDDLPDDVIYCAVNRLTPEY